jgi:UDP-N-acetylmuramate--alanine ligase
MQFTLHLPDGSAPLPVTLNLPGAHNVRNALGAIAIAWELSLDLPAILPSLASFQGIGRRFSEVGELSVPKGRVRIVEDYGHHPSELSATMSAAREGWPERRLVVVFQPHRYSRTRDLFDEFSQVLAGADAVILTDIYAAGEDPIDGIDSGALCQSIRARGRVNPILVSNVADLPRELPSMLEDGDLVLLLGAGNIGAIAQALREDGFAGEGSG